MLTILGFISRWMFRLGKHFFCRNCLEHISAWLEFTFPHEKGSWSEFGTFAKWRLTCSLAIKKSKDMRRKEKPKSCVKRAQKYTLVYFPCKVAKLNRPTRKTWFYSSSFFSAEAPEDKRWCDVVGTEEPPTTPQFSFKPAENLMTTAFLEHSSDNTKNC